MKRLMLLIVFVCVLGGLFAQVGLLGLYYGENYSTALSNLRNVDWVLVKNWPVTKSLGLENPETYYKVDLYVNPSTSKIVGWCVNYLDGLSEQEQADVLAECKDLHGDSYYVDNENNMVIWQIDSTKSLSLGCDEDGNLKVAVYYDEAYQSVFDRSEETP